MKNLKENIELNIPKKIVKLAKTDSTRQSPEVVARVLYLLSENIPLRKVASDCGIAVNTALSIKQNHATELRQVATDKAVKAVSVEERIINKYLNLTEKKADMLDANNDLLANTRGSELTGVIKDLHNKLLLDMGKATNISQSISTNDYDSAKVEITRIVKAINDNDTITLLEHLRATRD